MHEFKRIDAYSSQSTSLHLTQQTVCPHNQQSTTSSPQNIDLTVVVSYLNACDEFFTDAIKSLLTSVRITHLETPYDGIFVGTLIRLICLLPNLDSFRVWHLSLTKPRCLYGEEAVNLSLITNKNKITKVNIKWMTDLSQLQFILSLCPCIRYLEIDCSDNANLTLLIRFIFIRSTKYVSYLSVLCFCFGKLNDKKIKQFEKMISLEKFGHDYTIKHTDKKIYLQWKQQ